MRSFVDRWIPLLVVAACGSPAPDVAEHGVGGRVRGLWDRAEPVTLRLHATDGADEQLAVPANGDFRFATAVAEGARYTIEVVASPARHACAVAAGDSGTVAGAEIASIEIECQGPAVTISPSGRWAWTFDPMTETQTLVGSVVMQAVGLTIHGDELTEVAIDGVPVEVDAPSPPTALGLGETTIAVQLTATGGLARTYRFTFDRGPSVIQQAAYGKASNTRALDMFGYAIALEGDTLAVGAPGEDSGATGINGDQASTAATDSGAVYVFVRTGATWTQQAYLKASNTGPGDHFGTSISLSGNTLAVGAPYESDAGAAYVFVRNGATWRQQAHLKASNTDAFNDFGSSVSLSGHTLVVGAPGEDSAATGVNGNQTNSDAPFSGAVYVFLRTGRTWAQQAYLKASNTDADDQFGFAVSLSGDTVAVSAVVEASAATGVNGDQLDNTAPVAGAVYVFTRSGTTWKQQAYLKASNTDADDRFGWSLSLSGDTLAVGAMSEASAATGIDGDQADNSASQAGAVYVFVRAAAAWTQQAYLKASNTEADDVFGFAVSLAGDLLVVGAPLEDSAATGVDGDQGDGAANSGAAYAFLRTGATWSQRAYLKASNSELGDSFGHQVLLAGDALVVGAVAEDSAAVGIDGDQANGDASGAGAIYALW